MGVWDKIFLCFNGKRDQWLIQTDFSQLEQQPWECFLPWLSFFASYPSSGFKTPLYSAQLERNSIQAVGIKTTTIQPFQCTCPTGKPLNNRDGISQMNWITPRYSALAHQGAGTGAGGPPPSHPPAHPAPGVCDPGADSDWGGHGGAHQAGRRIIL